MCTPALAIAGISAVATVGGAVMSASNAASVAKAQQNAAQQTALAQNAGFMQRMAAQSDQQQRDYASQTAAIQARGEAESQMEAQQRQQFANREQQIQSANDQTSQIQAQAQKAAADAMAQAGPAEMAAAKARQQQQIQQLAAGGVNDIQSGTTQTPSGPVAAPTTTDSQTASAIATRLAQAASATRQYAAQRGAVASEAAPLALAGNTAQALETASTPLVSRERQIVSGLPTYLQPTTVGYQNAKNYYQNLLDVISARTQGRLNVSKAIAEGAITNADLVQADRSTFAQNQAAEAAWKAASDPLPGILSGVGQAGLYGAGYLGAGTGLSNLLGFGGGPEAATASLAAGGPPLAPDISGSNLTALQGLNPGNAALTAAGNVDNSLLTSIRNWAQKPFFS